MKKIQLTQGRVALVDDEDYEWLSQWKWFYDNGYALRNNWKPTHTIIYMHREIMNTPKSKRTDHKDTNGLNNQKSNLRICTQSENLMYRGKQKNNTSGYKGVTFDNAKQKWMAQIKVNRKKIYLGRYKKAIDAAHAYDDAAQKYHGEFARLNFPGVN